MDDEKKVATTTGGAIGISVFASFIGLCCIGPWAVVLFGVSGAVTMARWAPLRPYIIGVAAVMLTDINVSYAFDNGITVNLSGNNIFDVTPDNNRIGNSRTGAIEDGPGGAVIVDSAGVFQYSRRSAPFGFNGAYYSVGASWNF